MYPIIDLNYFDKDIHRYLRSLESIVIDALKSLGTGSIRAGRVSGLTGVWVGDYKVAAIGVKNYFKTNSHYYST